MFQTTKRTNVCMRELKCSYMIVCSNVAQRNKHLLQLHQYLPALFVDIEIWNCVTFQTKGGRKDRQTSESIKDYSQSGRVNG